MNSDRIARMGLVPALETEIERINKTDEFTGVFICNDRLLDFDNDKAIILYRMAQEALNNALKHSMATRIELHLAVCDNKIVLRIKDDGKGFDTEVAAGKGNSAGLHNLQKRAALINANLNIQSSPADGTMITIELPYFSSAKAD